MQKPNALSRGEKWIVVLTLIFSLVMVGIYFHSTRIDDGDEYTIRAGSLAERAEPMDAVQWQVNINTATAEELTRLPGVGEVLAERIVEYREQYGPFREAEELMKVNGIGESKFADMKEQVILEEEAEQ